MESCHESSCDDDCNVKKRKKKYIKKLKKVRKNFCNDIEFLAKIQPSIKEREKILGNSKHQKCLRNDTVSESEENEIVSPGTPCRHFSIKKRMKKKKCQKRDNLSKSDESLRDSLCLPSSTDTDIYLQNDKD